MQKRPGRRAGYAEIDELWSQRLGSGMSGRLDGIQILRFIAAAMVLIQHAVFLPSVHYGVNTMPFLKLGLGTAGVYIFFVISGYVIAELVDQSPLRFALHRIARVYPPYIASIAIGAALMILLGGITLEKIRWVWSFTLLPLGRRDRLVDLRSILDTDL